MLSLLTIISLKPIEFKIAFENSFSVSIKEENPDLYILIYERFSKTSMYSQFGGICGCWGGCCCCGACCPGDADSRDILSTSRRQVGHVCWRWNHERRQLVWKMWLQGSFLHDDVISSRQMIHTLSPLCSSSVVASGYLFVYVIEAHI